jgi:hypothetical protein
MDSKTSSTWPEFSCEQVTGRHFPSRREVRLHVLAEFGMDFAFFVAPNQARNHRGWMTADFLTAPRIMMKYNQDNKQVLGRIGEDYAGQGRERALADKLQE